MPFDPVQLLATHWDSKDVASFVAEFADDATWTINTSPAAVGTAAVKATTEALMGTAKSSRHHDLLVSAQDKTVVCHGAVEYEIEGKDNKIVCRFCDVFEMNDDGKIAKCWTYMDVSPLAA